MVDLTDQINGVTLEITKVRRLLDSPSNQFLKDDTVTDVLVRSYNWVVDRIDVTEFTGQSIADAIYAMTVWQLYMIYVESVSEYFKQQNPRIIMERADDFKKVAMLYLEAIGIIWPFDKDGMTELYDVKTVNAKYGYAGVAGCATLTEIYDN